MSGGDIIAKREHGDGGLADRESRCGDDRRQKPLEPFSRFGEFGRYARCTGMNLGTHMVRDKPDDPLAVGCGKMIGGCAQAFGQLVEPKPPIGVEHDLDDLRVVEISRDGRAKGGTQHARSA